MIIKLTNKIIHELIKRKMKLTDDYFKKTNEIRKKK